jgi:hypothetical protein
MLLQCGVSATTLAKVPELQNLNSFIGRDEREAESKSSLGPGSYFPDDRKVKHREPTYTIGRADFHSYVDKQQLRNPGVGDYEIKSSIGTDSPRR